MSNGAPFRISAKKLPEEPKENFTWMPVCRVKAAPTFCMAALRSEAAATLISWAEMRAAKTRIEKNRASLRNPHPLMDAVAPMLDSRSGNGGFLPHRGFYVIVPQPLTSPKGSPKLGFTNGTFSPEVLYVKIYVVHVLAILYQNGMSLGILRRYQNLIRIKASAMPMSAKPAN